MGDKLLKTSSRDVETGFENRFYGVGSEEGDNLEILVANIGHVLSKAATWMVRASSARRSCTMRGRAASTIRL